MTQKTKRQHYVPRCYLARFSRDGERLFAFDKADRRAFPTNVMNVAQQRYFYDLPEESVTKAFPGQQIDIQFVEKALSRAEGVANSLLSEIIDVADRHRVLPRDLRWSLAPNIILQYMRTRLTREVMLESNEKRMQTIVNDVLRKECPDVSEDHYPRIMYNKELMPINHARLFFAMARQVANAASNAACFSTKLAAVWIMRTVKSDTESLGGHSRIPLQSALGRRGEPGKRSSQPGNSPTRDEKRLGNSGFQ